MEGVLIHHPVEIARSEACQAQPRQDVVMRRVVLRGGVMDPVMRGLIGCAP
jgi:hypothetical protein